MNIVERLNSTVYCRVGPSGIHGVGVFAIRDISKGTCIWRWDKEYYLITEGQLELLLPEVRDLLLDYCVFHEGQHIFPIFSPNSVPLQVFMNQSDDPNYELGFALKDIKKGEEVVEDYRRAGVVLHRICKKHFQEKFGMV